MNAILGDTNVDIGCCDGGVCGFNDRRIGVFVGWKDDSNSDTLLCFYKHK